MTVTFVAVQDLAAVEKAADDMLGPWRWKECILRKKVVTGPRLNRVLSVLNPELRLPERPMLRALEGSRKGVESEDEAPETDGEAGAAQPTTGRGRARKKVGARKPVDADSPRAQKRARQASPEPSVEVVSASEEEDAGSAEEEAHDSYEAGPSVVPNPLAPLRVRTTNGEPLPKPRKGWPGPKTWRG